jgi:hypothetical protein
MIVGLGQHRRSALTDYPISRDCGAGIPAKLEGFCPPMEPVERRQYPAVTSSA